MSEIKVPTVVDGIEWDSIRQGIKSCIEAALTEGEGEEAVLKARVYSSWPLKFDVGQTVELLTSETDNDKVHAWIVGINRAMPADGGKSGGHYLEWPLTLRVWGFLGYDSVYTADTQSIMEKELRAVTRVIYANSKTFGQDDVFDIKSSGIVQWEEIDTFAFGSNDDVIVAKGSLELTVREHYSGY